MTVPPTTPATPPWRLRLLAGVLTAAGVVAVGVFAGPRLLAPAPPAPPMSAGVPLAGAAYGAEPPRQLASGRRLTLWWDVLPTQLQAQRTGTQSNIHPADYIGPQACASCHPRNHESWSHHPHRWMNALADEFSVKGDFSAAAAIRYQGGRATFTREAGRFLMRTERDGVRRTYQITQTIGSRFFQYYVGKLVEGPEPRTHHFYAKDHVLPFGYWLAQKEWVPIIHVGQEQPDGRRPDAFAPPDRGGYYAEYAVGCNSCHTTFALADMFVRRTGQMGEYAAADLHWSLRGYLTTARPELLEALSGAGSRAGPVANPTDAWEAPNYAVTLGVSCEACHLGARAHAASGGKVPPKFFPSSPNLYVAGAKVPEFGRTHDNVNWACGRCHVGNRPTFAAGMSTWNSVEYSDAMRGSCYSQLRCIDCHNPHKALGARWSQPPDQDDALCLKCHDQLAPADRRAAHTHHPAGSAGARCMNCHMPRINEGIEDVVRTHMIYSPTRADMIEANHPNACNLCHTDRPIDWTLRYLKEWYGAGFTATRIAVQYPDRNQPVARGWLHSDDPAVRLVAAEAMARRRDMAVLPELLGALDDPYLANRQFAYKGLQEMLGVRLADFGYRFYQSPEERRQPLDRIRAQLLRPGERRNR